MKQQSVCVQRGQPLIVLDEGLFGLIVFQEPKARMKMHHMN